MIKKLNLKAALRAPAPAHGGNRRAIQRQPILGSADRKAAPQVG